MPDDGSSPTAKYRIKAKHESFERIVAEEDLDQPQLPAGDRGWIFAK
jgi:hypothetical protein